MVAKVVGEAYAREEVDLLGGLGAAEGVHGAVDAPAEVLDAQLLHLRLELGLALEQLLLILVFAIIVIVVFLFLPLQFSTHLQ
jgi:hypothetical protein